MPKHLKTVALEHKKNTDCSLNKQSAGEVLSEKNGKNSKLNQQKHLKLQETSCVLHLTIVYKCRPKKVRLKKGTLIPRYRLILF